MRPTNANTDPDQLFFFPYSSEVEHHESLDVTRLPGVIHVGDNKSMSVNNFVVYETADGDEEAQEAYWSPINLPAGATITQINSVSEDRHHPLGGYVHTDEDLVRLSDTSTASYSPHSAEGVHSIIRLDRSRVRPDFADLLFDEHSIAILPVSEPLPTVDPALLRNPDHNDLYKLLGFITPQDRLAIWTKPTDYNTRLVDWSVATALRNNSLEADLLNAALPPSQDLVGLLKLCPVASAYLQYFDTKYSTHFMPQKDPRSDRGEVFPPMTDAQRTRFNALSALALQLS